MAKNLTKNLIDLSYGSFSPNSTTELGFNHGESSFDVRPLVIMAQEYFPIKVVEVPHSSPETVKPVMMVCLTSGVGFEGDKRCSAHNLNRFEIASVGVGFVSTHFIDVKYLGCLIHQWDKLAVIRGFIRSSLNTRNNVSLDTAHNVWSRMAIVDTKPFMPPAILRSIFAHKQPVTGNQALPADAAGCRRPRYIR